MAAIRSSAVNCAFPSWKATHMEMQWWIWLVFGVALVLLELVLPTFFILWFGIGAVLVALIALIAPSLQLDSQVLLWVLFSSATTLLWFKLFRRKKPDVRWTADSVIGEVLQKGRVDGRLVIVALHFRPIPTNFLDVLMKQFTVRGSMEYPERFEDAIELLGRRDLSAVISHKLSLEEFGDGLAILEGSKDCGKVMITMEGAQ